MNPDDASGSDLRAEIERLAEDLVLELKAGARKQARSRLLRALERQHEAAVLTRVVQVDPHQVPSAVDHVARDDDAATGTGGGQTAIA